MTPTEIRELRRQAGHTQEQMALRVGVPVDTYRNWERGKRTPTTAGLTCLLQTKSAIVDKQAA